MYCNIINFHATGEDSISMSRDRPNCRSSQTQSFVRLSSNFKVVACPVVQKGQNFTTLERKCHQFQSASSSSSSPLRVTDLELGVKNLLPLTMLSPPPPPLDPLITSSTSVSKRYLIQHWKGGGGGGSSSSIMQLTKNDDIQSSR